MEKLESWVISTVRYSTHGRRKLCFGLLAGTFVVWICLSLWSATNLSHFRESSLDAGTRWSNSSATSLSGVRCAELPHHGDLSECFSLVIFTHDRVDTFFMTMYHYMRMRRVHQVVVLWSSQSEPPQIRTGTASYGVPVMVRHLKDDKIRSRFVDLPRVRTEAILQTDDDTLIGEDDIERAFQLWKENKNRFIGFNARSHRYIGNNNWLYVYSKGCCDDIYSIVLTQVNLYHKRLNTEFQKINIAMKNLIDSIQNCEDLAMNMVAAQQSKDEYNIIYVKPKQRTHLPSLFTGQLHDRKGHYIQRSMCLTFFARFFDEQPLRNSTLIY